MLVTSSGMDFSLVTTYELELVQVKSVVTSNFQKKRAVWNITLLFTYLRVLNWPSETLIRGAHM